MLTSIDSSVDQICNYLFSMSNSDQIQSHTHLAVAAIGVMALNLYAYTKYAQTKKSRIIDDQTPRSKKILEVALTSKAIKNLYERANSTLFKGQSGPWTIAFSDNIGHHGAECILEHRKIYIRSDLSDGEALTSFVFELANGINSQRFYDLHEKAFWGKIDCETFAIEMERIEYESVILHHKVISEAINEMGWSQELDLYTDIDNFEQYLKCQESGHTDAYKKDYQMRNNKIASFVRSYIGF